MEAELKAKWVAALRSGDYRQGEGTLRTPENLFCCLGVLCDLVAPDQWAHPTIEEYDEEDELVVTDDDRWFHSFGDDVIDPEDASVLGLRFDDNTTEEFGDAVDFLAGMNDRGESFDTIATYIEEHIQ